MDRKGGARGATHAVAVPTSQAMLLLRLLEHLQQRFSLSKPQEEIAETGIAAQAQAGEAQK
jgi:hypothetical protein